MLAGLATLVLIGSAIWVSKTQFNGEKSWCGGSGSGLSRISGECVGVTDGSGGYYFSSDLKPVEKLIATANETALKSGKPVVTVALLEPITVNGTSALTATEIRNAIEGAYTAQVRANTTRVAGDETPLIRLVLANEGGHEDQWPQVAAQLESMIDSPQPLVAVGGLGVSTTETLRGAQELSSHHIPTVGAINTADQLNSQSIPGFIRVAASNQQAVTALKSYLGGLQDTKSAIMVFDSNSDMHSSPDLFTASLRSDLQATFTKLLEFAPQGFVGLSGKNSANPDLFSSITTNICAVKPSVVLYAGRSVDLSGFLASLERRVCADTPITVATVGTNLNAFIAQADTLRSSKITLIYSTQTASPDWLANSPDTPTHFADFAAEFNSHHFPKADLTDGGTIAAHDSILTAARAIRLATQNGSTPKASDVFSQVLNLNNQFIVPGAGGDLSFSYHPGANGSESSDPIGKPLPLITVPRLPTPTQRQDTYVTTH
ncbi:ABC transporter substrate-binding protein [Streptomyces sp. IBSBF 2435]|uniref:ABC transporter substrate-binding protein n=1 Tax=Streptomyces sp. IBSBF 2435 TaxID=2903531 RepID=UPI002FDC40D9